jgi:hypothetical protein
VISRRSFAAGLFFAAAARGQVSKAKERGDALVKECIGALGGDRFLSMQDRVESGRAYSFYRERLTGLSIAKLYTRYPNPPQPIPESYYGILERQTFGKKEDSAILFNEKGAFEVTFRGARPLPDQTSERHHESTVTNFLYILRQRLHEPGITFESQGVEVVENQRVEAVDLFDNSDRKITVYLVAQTKLPVMQRYMRFDKTYKVRIEEITRFSKYRDAGGGVMWPLDVQRERDGEKVYQMFSDNVVVGNHLPADFFELPAGANMLKKQNS